MAQSRTNYISVIPSCLFRVFLEYIEILNNVYPVWLFAVDWVTCVFRLQEREFQID
uniref:Uncharacterized protein n=1 Tax=Anguilla anguilla TaxID=7936 RepID=A0A0E9R1T7_ANGAN